MHPLVSIGLPVFNGERYLAEAIRSILAQTFTDFELIICDNASTDGTADICRAFAGSDARVRYYRNETNIGAAPNYNRTLELARGKYFKWCAHDDLCAPQFLERCIEVLEREPSVVLAYTRTRDVDEAGDVVCDTRDPIEYLGLTVSARFRETITVSHKRHSMIEIFGLIRMEALRKTEGIGKCASGDRVLLVRLALLGEIRRVPEFLFFRRTHRGRSIFVLPSYMGGHQSLLSRIIGSGLRPPPEWYDPSLKGKIVFPYWRLIGEFSRALRSTPLHMSEKSACYLYLGGCIARSSPRLVRDAIAAAEQVYRKLTTHTEQPAPQVASSVQSPVTH